MVILFELTFCISCVRQVDFNTRNTSSMIYVDLWCCLSIGERGTADFTSSQH